MRSSAIALTISLLAVPQVVLGYSIQEAEEDLRDRRFEDVLQQLKVDGVSTAEDRAYTLVLLGTAAFGREDYETALAFYERILTEGANSRWLVKATYRKAECLMRLERYAQAEAIYAQGIEGLMSDERRVEIAELYTHHADRFYAPERKSENPDYERARGLYERAKDILPDGARRERAGYQIAMTHFKLEKWDEAQRSFSGLIASIESSGTPGRADVLDATSEAMPNPYPPGGFLEEAMLLRGEALFRLGNPNEARRIWKRLRDKHRTGTRRLKIIADAAYRVAKTYNIPHPESDRELSLGIRSLDEYLVQFPDHENVPRAALDRALAYEHRARFEKAIEQYREFLERFDSRASAKQKATADFRIARCLVALQRFEDGIAAYQAFLIQHSGDENWRAAQQAVVDTRFAAVQKIQNETEKEHTRWRKRVQSEKGGPDRQTVPEAIADRFAHVHQSWASFLEQYPLDRRVAWIGLRLGANEKLLQRFESAIQVWRDIAARFPKTDQASEALFRIAETTEKDLQDLERAIKLYGDVTFGAPQDAAAKKIRELQRVSLALKTKKRFSTGEPPSVSLTLRNIDHVTCKLYPLDLEDYFSSKHTIRGVENLDVNLIAAERIWEVTPENYQPHKEMTEEIAVPVEKAGAWVVQVESETLEAVTLLLVSDLALAVRGGRKEVLVYTEDQRREKGAEGVDILVSDGESVLARGKTNADGIFHARDFDAPNAQRLMIFASRQGHWAGETLSIKKLSVASSLQPRVYIYSDRATYQPGDRVDYRALIREIDDGRYTVPQEHDFAVSVTDPHGDVIHKETCKLSEFGTLNGRLDLDETAPHGEYRITVSRKNGPSGAWPFQVRPFTLPTTRVQIETERETYFYGDEVSGTITVDDFSGNPLSGVKVECRLPDGRFDGVSDDKGELEFRFETWDLPEVGPVGISVHLPAHQRRSEKIVMLVNTGFTIALETIRSTYLAGEAFHVDVKTQRNDTNGELVQKPLTLKLQKRNDEGVYTTVETRNVTTTTDEHRSASLSFTMKEGGAYRLLAEGKDRRGTTVSTQRKLSISDETDENKLLVLCDRARYRQGETATFNVVSRLPENLCLMLGEREGIVEYRLVRLGTGQNSVTWNLDDRYSPSATIVVMMMHEGRFYRREVQFDVRRGLDISVTPQSETAAPGDDVELLLQAKDHTGQPVVTELSVGLIDTALLALFPDRRQEMAAFFEQAPRGRFMAASSSADFAYTGVTRPVVKEILEQRRRAGERYLAEGESGEGLRAGTEIRESSYGVMGSLGNAPFQVGENFQIITNVAVDEAAVERLGRGEVAAKKPASAPHAHGGVSSQPIAFGNLFSSVRPESEAARYVMALKSDAGAMVAVPRTCFPETAYFNPVVVTDADGRAVLHVRLPDSLTTWEVQAHGITKKSLAGQAKAKIVVDKPHRVRIEAPAFLTEGDTSSAIARIRNNTNEKHDTEATFIQTVAGRDRRERWKTTLNPGALHKQIVPLSADAVGNSTLTLRSRTRDEADSLVKPVPVLPWGIPIRTGKSALAGQSVVETISLSSKADYSNLRMWITLGGVGDISMLAPAWSGSGEGKSTRAAIEKGLAALAVLECVEKRKNNDGVPVERLRAQVATTVRRTLAAQSESGLWAWGGGRNQAPDILTTGRATEFLEKARQRGWTVPGRAIERAVSELDALYQKSVGDGLKARILYARSCISPLDFTHVNRIHRSFKRLEELDAALLGLTWLNMGRTEKAHEVLEHLLQSPQLFAQKSSTANGTIQRVGQRERMANAARLYFQLPARSRTQPNTQRFVEALLSDVTSVRRHSPTPLGLRIQALAGYLASAAGEDQSYTLAVKVNGTETAERRTNHSVMPYARIEIDTAKLKPSDNRVEFAFSGKGRYRYSIVLEGWSKQDVRPQEWDEPSDRLFDTVRRKYSHGPLLYKHEEIPRGTSVVQGNCATVKNELKAVRPGDTVEVHLETYCRKDQSYVTVRDRIPAGFILVEDSIRGHVESHVLEGNELTFFMRGRLSYYSVRYRLRARFPGAYRIPPGIVWTAEAPGRMGATSSRSIVILPDKQEPQEEYKLTPDELYHLGLKYFDDGAYDPAETHLTALLDTYALRAAPYLETAKRLFQIHLKGGNAEELVRTFEIVKERDPAFEIHFDQIATLAKAYRDIGEHERAVYVYRSLFDGLFKQEGAVSGALQQVNRHRQAIDYMKQLILEYPDIPSVQLAVYTAGTIVQQNVEAWSRDPEFVKSGNEKNLLLAEAVGMIESFLALYPNHPMGDEAGYTLINLWLTQKNFTHVGQLAASFAKRYEESIYLDSYDYLRAHALLDLERYDEALRLARRVSTRDYPAPGGGTKKSDEGPNAIHMAAKMLHASGKIDEAIQEYQRVEGSFDDAARALKSLTDNGLGLEEVSVFRSREPVSILMRYKNLERVELRVYKVDLMTFYLTERNLERMTAIDLAGISPVIERNQKTKRGKRSEWNEMKLDFDLSEPGAYLLVAARDGAFASGMILRSDLELEVQEDVSAGLVRVNARKHAPAEPLKKVEVRVRGGRDRDFVTGETDLRGVFSANGIHGAATVLARLGGQYGFYRGTQSLGPEETPEAVAELKLELGDRIQDDGMAFGNNSARLLDVQNVQNQRWIDTTNISNTGKSTQKVQTLY